MGHTPKLEMPEMIESQASKYITHNEALRIIDGVTQCTVIDKDLIVPPASPSDGDTYIVGLDTDSTSGDWEGHDSEITYYKSSAWIFIIPLEGWRAYVQDEGISYVYEPSLAASGDNPWLVEAVGAVRELASGVDIRMAVIEIGDWNMDADATLSVNSALIAFSAIRAVDVIVRNDSGFSLYPLAQKLDGSGNSAGSFGVTDAGGDVVTYALVRTAGSTFDAPAFSTTSYNRGWITIRYEA